MKIEDFDYHLPKKLIAQKTVSPKDSSKLLVVKDDSIEHKHFYDVIDYLKKDDVLVINETKVKRAKILGEKTTGAKGELTLLKKINDTDYECMIKSHRLKVGDRFILEDGSECEIIDIPDQFIIRFKKPIENFQNYSLPLPPYVKEKVKDEEYQTVYSKKAGSLAAPTAGLHFTKELMEKIEEKGVKIAKICLHIDYGTFLPVRGKISEHKMHKEEYEVSKQTADLINNRKGKLVVVGTTSVRTLESCADDTGKIIPKKGITDIFIYPGYKFKTKIDQLITNFHLPKSTLLMLVSAFFGREKILESYKEAVKKKYRFFSLGDSMILIKN